MASITAIRTGMSQQLQQLIYPRILVCYAQRSANDLFLFFFSFFFVEELVVMWWGRCVGMDQM